MQQIKLKYPKLRFELFDINRLILRIYQDPTVFGLDPEKLTRSYLEDHPDPIDEHGTSQADKFFYWDEVHPTTEVWPHLTGYLQELLETIYSIKHLQKKPTLPGLKSVLDNTCERVLVEQFKDAYSKKISLDRERLGGFLRQSKFPNLSEQTKLQDIQAHGLFKNNRTNQVLKELGWGTEDNQISLIP